FLECLGSVESRAFRHLFFAERRAPAEAARAREVSQAAVLGAGTMGAGIARMRSAIDAAERKGRLDAEEAAAARERVQGSLTLAAAASVDLVIEAVFENLAVKREVFGRLGQVCRAGAVLATNTSTLDVDAIAAASGRPADVV